MRCALKVNAENRNSRLASGTMDTLKSGLIVAKVEWSVSRYNLG